MVSPIIDNCLLNWLSKVNHILLCRLLACHIHSSAFGKPWRWSNCPCLTVATFLRFANIQVFSSSPLFRFSASTYFIRSNSPWSGSFSQLPPLVLTGVPSSGLNYTIMLYYNCSILSGILDIGFYELVHKFIIDLSIQMHEPVSEFCPLPQIMSKLLLKNSLFLQHSKRICIIPGRSVSLRSDNMIGHIQTAFDADL